MTEYLALLQRNRNFRLLWWGNVISLLGDWFNLIASASLIASLTDSGVAISYLFLVRFVPLFVVSPFAGVVADRFSRKRILIASDLLRAVTVLGFLLVRSPEQVWLLYILTAVQFTLSAFFSPARSALLANIVAREDLVTANALDSFTWSTMLALGAFAGGVVAALFGLQTAFIADAVTFVLSAVVIAGIVTPGQARTAVTTQTGWLDFLDGFRFLRQHTFLLVIALVKAAGSLVWGGINVLEIKYANEIFALSDRALPFVKDGATATLGMIYVVSGLGTGLGPLFMRRRLGDRPPRILAGIAIGFVLTGMGIISLGLAPTLLLFLAATLVRTVGTGTIWVFSAALLQTMTPDVFRGRVFAFEFAALTLTQSISVLAAGYGLDNLGWAVQQVTLAFGVLGFVMALLWFGFMFTHRTAIRVQETWSQEVP
ncbi:MAG: MFS transporter [Chloroflexi bacterium]|nr:MFS transporter [Ardenticatenaceae bacterium]MBL1128438.1 MFS transporter [Chloroflexota bacterium]NOG34516.1 MFS transporter [Chloroflexota bacterium]GIK58880.1 MAG: MFS transporter [Chloroflexota bacterium]